MKIRFYEDWPRSPRHYNLSNLVKGLLGKIYSLCVFVFALRAESLCNKIVQSVTQLRTNHIQAKEFLIGFLKSRITGLGHTSLDLMLVKLSSFSWKKSPYIGSETVIKSNIGWAKDEVTYRNIKSQISPNTIRLIEAVSYTTHTVNWEMVVHFFQAFSIQDENFERPC